MARPSLSWKTNRRHFLLEFRDEAAILGHHNVLDDAVHILLEKIRHMSVILLVFPAALRIRIQSGQWTRIQIRNPDPDPGGQK
jgi:hypothetical protein